MTALLIICREKNIPSLNAFEEELLNIICCAPSYCLNSDTIAAGSFCWSWISVFPSFSRSSLYLNLRYSLLIAINTGGIFESNSIQSSLIPDRIYSSSVLEFQKQNDTLEMSSKHVSQFMDEISEKIDGDIFSNITYNELNCYFSRDVILEGLDIWLKFIMNQIKVILFIYCRIQLEVIYRVFLEFM